MPAFWPIIAKKSIAQDLSIPDNPGTSWSVLTFSLNHAIFKRSITTKPYKETLMSSQFSKTEQRQIEAIENFRNQNPKEAIIATHPGNFHADDVCAVATLKLLYPKALIIRSRYNAVLSLCTFRVDVGEKDNVKNGDFDHHQEGGAGKRTNGIQYASFGLVWSVYGLELCDHNKRMARFIDKILVQGVDGVDNGQALVQGKEEFQGARPFDLATALSNFNPNWDEEAEVDTCFMEAVDYAKSVIKRVIARNKAINAAQGYVRSSISTAIDPRIIVFERNCPWKGVIIKEAPDARFVVYPNDEGMWCVQAIPKEFGSFENRLDMPAHWAKTNGKSFADISGVRDAEFIHQKLFFCTAGSRKSAVKLAEMALQHNAKIKTAPATPADVQTLIEAYKKK